MVDVLISKTFDASVICPAEQTCIIDDEVYDEVVAEFVRMGAHLITDERGHRLADFAFGGGATQVNMVALGQKAPELAAPGRPRGRSRPPRSCSPRCPTDLDRSPRTRWGRRS